MKTENKRVVGVGNDSKAQSSSALQPTLQPQPLHAGSAETSFSEAKKTIRSWQESYNALVQYKEKYGDCNVPRNYSEDKTLGGWVHQQRATYEKLTTEQEEKLLDIGFCRRVAKQPRTWMESYQLLVQYKEKHGDANVPGKYKEDKTLGRWLQFQKENYDNLSSEKKKMLRDIGFQRGPQRSRQPWQERFELLVEFKKQHGDCNVSCKDDASLAEWVKKQRMRYDTLSEEQKKQLQDVGFVRKLGKGWKRKDVEPTNGGNTTTIGEAKQEAAFVRSPKIETNDNNHSNKNDKQCLSKDGLSKDERRRFKKLRKRATLFRPENGLGGILQRQEWDEVKQTRSLEKNSSLAKEIGATENATDNFCPWIGVRQTQRRLQELDKVREGVDHRLLLKSLYMQQMQTTTETESNTNSRKRKVDHGSKIDFLVPPWMSVHNPACADHVAVIEVQIDDRFSLEEFAASLQISGNEPSLDEIAATVSAAPTAAATGPEEMKPLTENKETHWITTEWFQGPRPQSISDVLLYENPTKASKNKKAKKGDTDDPSKSDESNFTKLEETLQSMTLTREQMKQEGYPVALWQEQDNTRVVRKVSASRDVSSTFRKPSSITLEQAKVVVALNHVPVEDKDRPFVMDRSQSRPTNNGSNKNEEPKENDIRVYGLDCEMVKTDHGTELGRITLVQYTDINSTNASAAAVAADKSNVEQRYRVLIDELVKPYHPILDYVTQYSGLTADMLNNVNTRLEQIQASLLTLIRPQDILVGHSLENDLIALRWVHPNVIDTAVLFRTNAAYKHSLRHLSNVLLKRKIQGGEHHCSEEDAAAALELAIGRAEQGSSFAIHPRDRLFWIPTDKKQNDAAAVFIGPSQWLQEHVTRHPNAMHALTCETIDSPNRRAISSWLTGPKRRAGLVWANLVVQTPEHQKLLGILLRDLYIKMSPSTILMINMQHSPSEALELAKQKRMCQNPRTTLAWSDENEIKYQTAVERCRKGKVVWLTRHSGPK